ncbi:MAG TPA: TIGR03619 family F420-dependent LLM class oxidoreductase [Acidimicrobiia bacterium]|nr:TIGR03619 family F420-dependent LLM class oxidoreductase [Acidimicrobiia bacterium]
MRVSLELPVIHPTGLARCAAAIEAAGFDACFVTDHPFPPRVWLEGGGHETLDPFVALSFAAAATNTLRLHTHCLIPAYRNPFTTAKAIAALDACSNGRIILGVAAGYLRSEFEQLGVPFDARGQRLDDTLTAMRAAWAGEAANVLHPEPVQRPHPPIWVGGNTDAAMRRAATAEGWSPFPAPAKMASRVRTAALDDLDALTKAVHRYRELAGHERDVCFSPLSHPAMRDVANAQAFLDEAGELARIGVTWIAFHLPAPSVDGFCDTVSEFGPAVMPAVHAL